MAAQQAAIRRLEATVREQRQDIQAALSLVGGRPPAAAAADAGCGAADRLLPGEGLEPLEPFANGTAATALDGYSDWAAAPLPGDAFGSLGLGSDGMGAAEWDAVGDAYAGASGADPLASLLDAATAAADAATAWAGGLGASLAAAGPEAGWAQAGNPLASGGDVGSWSIPAVGGSRQGSPLRGAALGSPPKRAAAAGGSKRRGSQAPSAAASLQGSPSVVPGLAAVESDIAGLEDALRVALGDLSF